MVRVEIYTRFGCPFCTRAVNLLKAKGVDFEEIDIGMSGEKRQEMMSRANGRFTVPQIFIGGRHVGGSDDLAALDSEGRLDELLEAECG